MWKKIVHVQSSLLRKDNQYSLFIGRWQPFHKGHHSMFEQVLLKGGRVLIAIRDVVPDEKNPFTPSQVSDMISAKYKKEITEGKVKIIIIPDIGSVEFGRGVGYDIIEHVPPRDIALISATGIREQLKKEGRL